MITNNKTNTVSWLDYLTYSVRLRLAQCQTTKDDLSILLDAKLQWEQDTGHYSGYTKEDLLSGKTYENPVLHADYPIDIHSYKKDSSTLQHTTVDYEVPVDILKSANYDNLFIAGRCVSTDFSAQAALRIQTSCFSMGEAVAREVKKLLG